MTAPGAGDTQARCPAAGCLVCAACENDFYANEDQSECAPCPANSVITDPSARADVAECLCEAGFYASERGDGDSWGRPGVACLACPEGGYCAGGLAAPQNIDGWYV